MRSRDPLADRSAEPDRSGGPHPAVERARRVVGLYGDPASSQSIVLALRFGRPVEVSGIGARAEELRRRWPDLGPAPVPERFTGSERTSILERFASAPYPDAGPLVRIAVSTDGAEAVLAAHHGAVDGLGLLGLASRLLDRELVSSALGIGTVPPPAGFARRALSRIREALVDPPERIAAPDPAGPTAGDRLEVREVARSAGGSAALLFAAVRAVRSWNRSQRRPQRHRRPVVVAIGLSRRPGSPVPEPTRDTAYARVPVGDLPDVAAAAGLLAGLAPEPLFPAAPSDGPAARVAALLANRGAATVLVSNLGRVDGPDLETVDFWPVPSGPAGLCIGLAGAAERVRLTVRGRRDRFDAAALARFTDLVVEALDAARPPAGEPGSPAGQ